MTVTDLLKSDQYKFNQSKLARDLNISRGTLRAYMEDKKGDYHFVTGKELYTNQSNKVSNND